MLKKLPEHYSHNFEMDLNKHPAKASDRISPFICFSGVVLGIVLLLLGVFDQIPEIHSSTQTTSIFQYAGSGTDFSVPSAKNMVSDISRDFFDFFFIFIGLVVIIPMALSHLRYKKIIINDDSVYIINRTARGKKIKTNIKLSDYEGVRLRTEFCQYGLFHKVKHIIELTHKNEEKTVPLYITTKAKNIRNKWEEYAKRLNLPAIVVTYTGVEKREVKDFNKSIKELYKENKIADEYDPYEAIPEYLTSIKKNKKSILKPAKIYWDFYSFLIVGFVFVAVIIGALSITFYPTLRNAFGSTLLMHGYFIEFIAIVIPLMMLFKRQKIVIKKDKLIGIYKWPLGIETKIKLPKEHIEAIDIVYDYKKEQPYITITSDDKVIHFGKKLPIETLVWVKKFLIHHSTI